jgi:hypothetical protein
MQNDPGVFAARMQAAHQTYDSILASGLQSGQGAKFGFLPRTSGKKRGP